MRGIELSMTVALVMGGGLVPTAFGQEDKDKEEILRKLADVRISFDEKDASLGSIVERIKKAGDLNIHIDPAIAGDFALEGGRKCALVVSEVKLGTALKLLLRVDTYSVIYREKVVYITTRYEGEGKKSIFDMLPPPKPKPPVDPTPEQAKRIAQLIKDWESSKLKVREEAFKELVKIGEPAQKQLQEAVKSTIPEVRARAQRILGSFVTNDDLDVLKQLKNTRLNVKLENYPLPAYMDYLREQLKTLNFHIEAEGTENMMVNVDLKNLPLENHLNLVLEPHGLGYYVKDGIIFITTKDRVQRGEDGEPKPVPEQPPEQESDKNE